MKWFRHMADASDDEFISHLEDEMGLPGYALFWKCCEIVAFQMDESNRCCATYSWSKWRQKLKTNKPKLRRFLTIVEDNRKFHVTIVEDKLKIEIPKLLELRDNYTKNLQATDKKLASKEVEVEVEVEKKNSVVKEVVGHLNETMGTNYKHTTSTTISAIQARLKEGYTVEQFKEVHIKKKNEWNGTEHEKYLRPSTLYRPANFESYVNQTINKPKPKQPQASGPHLPEFRGDK